jgi:uncharacterized protein (TIGR02231 family)
VSEPRVVESVPRRVTLFEDRAEVVRVARVPLGTGAQWIAIAGVTPFLDDRSLQARVDPAAGTVVAARVRRRVHHEQALGRAEVAALEAEVRVAERRVASAQADGERAAAAQAHAQQMFAEWLKAVGTVPRFAADAARLAEWQVAHDTLEAAAAAARTQAHEATLAAEEAEDARDRAERRLAEGLALTPRRDTVVEVHIARAAPSATTAASVAEVDVELTYRTPCALWRPEHLARLRTAGGASATSATLELVSFATAWQATGERWEDVEVCFSTARTGSAAEPPRIADDVLLARKKTDEEKKRVVVEAREQAIAVAGLERGARAVDEMPGVDDGGEPLAFQPAARVTLVSDGRPFRVEIARASLPAETALVLYPERALAAHLRATASNTGGAGTPLLAGPVTVAREAALVGRARLDFVGAGEPFELGFGVADELRVRRAVDEDKETAALTGKQLVKRKVRLYLSNLSGEPRQVEITERVPVSEIEDVQVELTDAAWRREGVDGFARRVVELGPHEHRPLTLEYEIRAAARVTLPF